MKSSSHTVDRLLGTKVLTTNKHLIRWVEKMADLCRPDSIHWVDGSQEEYDFLCEQLVEAGTFIRLNEERWPGCFYARSTPNDVARVEDRTFICSLSKDAAGPTNNWENPYVMRDRAEAAFPRLHEGTHHVRAAVQHGAGGLAHVGHRRAAYGFALRGGEHAHHGAHRDAGVCGDRQGREARGALPAFGGHAAQGRASRTFPGRATTTKYIVHFPETREIWSYGSGYGGNALLGKKCFALRIASNIARDEGWMAEHMLILGVETPEGDKTYVAAAFPSACGKTNFAMMIPPKQMRGWKVTTVGDDIAWLQARCQRQPARHQPGGGLLRRGGGNQRTRRIRRPWPRFRATPSSPTWP